MKYEVTTNCCRVCLTKSKKLRSLYKPIDEGDEPPNEMLQKITGVEVEEMNKHTMLPKNICKNCELSLSMAFEFREKALQSQEVIVSYMKELQIPFEREKGSEFNNKKMPTIKKETKDLQEKLPSEEHTTDHGVEILHRSATPQPEHDSTIELELGEIMVPVKGEDVDDVADDIPDGEQFNEESLEDINYDEISSNADQQLYDVEEREINDTVHDVVEQEQEDEETQYAEIQQEIVEAEENKHSSKAWDLAQDVAQIEIDFDRELEVKQATSHRSINRYNSKKAPSTSQNESGYICDICGNVYAKRGRMMDHRQRHDKELKYACELCDKKFHMRELLRKHMYSHSGGKPLKCEYCSRTFYYESVRKAHEAVHQGVKPYICEVCNKAFGYSHSLKKHQLIHDEVKLYRCDYCNKDFRLQHHMKQHALTKSHQKAVYLARCQNDGSCVVMGNDEELADDVILEEENCEDEIANVS